MTDENKQTLPQAEDATGVPPPATGSLKRRGSLRAIRPIFAWYDLWIGLFWDRKNLRLYILPLPCVGVVIYFNAKPCGFDKHEWGDTYYGHQCKRCDAFYPTGCAPWDDVEF